MEELIPTLMEFGLGATISLCCLFIFYKVFCSMREDNQVREERDRETITRLSEIVSTNSKALLENSQVMKEISNQIKSMDDKLEDVKEDVREIKIKQEARERNH